MMIKTLVAAATLIAGLAASPATACVACGVKFNGTASSGLVVPPVEPVAGGKPARTVGARPVCPLWQCGFNGVTTSGLTGGVLGGFFVTRVVLPDGTIVGRE